MAFTPDQPSPKSAGDSIRSKDWNDLVTETKRLDTAKLERAGDAITGNLSIAGALAIGKAAATAPARLDVNGDTAINDRTLWFRGAADSNHGLAWRGPPQPFAGVAIDGPVLWGNNGGGLGSHINGNPGTDQLALTWDNGGRVSVGVPSTDMRFDVGGRIRLRQLNEPSAGLWLHQRVPNLDRAFVGMKDDNRVGFWGNVGNFWGVTMDVRTGDVDVVAELRSPRFKSTGLMMSRAGPLPISTNFTSSGGTLLTFMSGSGFRGTVGRIGMQLFIDSVNKGSTQAFTNEVNSHKSFPPAFLNITTVAAGGHTLELRAQDGNTVTDLNDFFHVTVLELPFRPQLLIPFPGPIIVGTVIGG